MSTHHQKNRKRLFRPRWGWAATCLGLLLITLVISMSLQIVMGVMLVGPRNGLSGLEQFTLLVAFVVLCIVAIPILAVGIAGARRSRQGNLLWVLAIALRNALALPEEIRALALSSRGRQRMKLSALADLLENGTPLPVALGRFPRLVAQDALTAIQLGQETGTLAETLRDVAVAHAWQQRERVLGRSSLSGVSTYVWFVFTLVIALFGFQAYWIIPKFKKILDGFQMSLPETTKLVMDAFTTIAIYSWLILPGVLLTAAVGYKVAKSEAVSPWLPWLTLWRRRRRTLLILRNLLHLVAFEKPLAQGLRAMSLRRESTAWGSALKQAAGELERGRPTWDALQAVGIISQAEWALLTAAERAGNLVWALRMVADRIERRRFDRMYVLAQLAHPLAIAVLGIVVGAYTLALFMPLVKVLQSLS